MKTRIIVVAAVAGGLALGQPMSLLAGEHKGFPWFWKKKQPATQEHGGQEHGGQPAAAAPGAMMPAEPVPSAMEPVPPMMPAEPAPAAMGPMAETQRPPEPPTPDQLRSTIEQHVRGHEEADGAFKIDDPKTGQARWLSFVRVHERVGKTGDYYYSCTDMRDIETGELLDLDFDVEQQPDGRLKIVDERIHKVDGQARYTYDENDNLIPLE